MSIFMKYGDIRGETADRTHPGFLDVRTVRFGIRRRISSHTGTRHDRESANAHTSDLYVTRFMDSASPALFIQACCGRGKPLTLRYTKTGTGDGAEVFMEYTLHNALLSRYDVLARSQAGARPVEVLRVSYTAVESRYTPYDQDGHPVAPIVQGFDTATNQRL